MEEIQKAINMLDQLRIDITKVENDDKVERDAYEIQQLLFKALDKVEKLPIRNVSGSTDNDLVNPNNCPHRANGFCTA